MASLRPTFTQLRGRCQASAPQWQQLRQMLQGLQISSKPRNTRSASTMPSGFNESVTSDQFAAFNMGRVKSALQDTNRRGGGETASSSEVQMPSHARVLPVSPSYFSRQPEFNDSYLMLQKLMRQYAHLPTVPTDQLEKAAFRTLRDYRLAVGEQIKASEYAKAMTLVKRLHKIHPSLQPLGVKNAIAKFKRDINPHNNTTKPIYIDKFGRALGVGKRKTSTARAWVVEGTGEVLVNGKSLADAFGRVHDRESAMWALKASQRVDKYNVWALVDGGGTTGQAEALTLAVAKALMAHEPALKPVLRRGGTPLINRLLVLIMVYQRSANTISSWMRNPGSKNRREKEARSPQGPEEACLGQALESGSSTAWNMHAHQYPIFMTSTEQSNVLGLTIGHQGLPCVHLI